MNPEMLGKIYEILNSLLPILCIMGVFYVMVILPQRKKSIEHQALLNDLKKGQSIVTNSGIFGTIESVSDHQVHLRISKDVVVVMEKSCIARLQDENGSKNSSKN